VEVGDLVLCTWQPSIRGVVNNIAMPIEHAIKGECGIIMNIDDPYRIAISFPSFGGYTHRLNPSAFEILNESR
jgi:hypothetical protein